MTIEQVDRLVRGANPVPDPEALAPIDFATLLVTLENDEVAVGGVKVDVPIRRPGKARHIGLALVGMTIFIGVLALVTMRDSREAAVSAAAVETSAAFVDAWGHSDPTAYTYLTDDASVSIYPTIGADQLDAEMRLRQAMGWVYEVDGCRVITVYKFEDETRAVLCAVTHHSAWSDGLGVEPITTARITLNVLGDRVRAAKLGFNRFQYDSEIKEWLTTNHPEDVNIMYQYPDDPTPSLSDEAIELWRQYTEEFAAENGG